MKENLPNLKIVPLEKLILHENIDPKRVSKLSKKILKDKIFINPPIVGKVKGMKKLIVLDGANRVSALQKLNFRDILVQILSYENSEIRLKKWNHLVGCVKKEQFWHQLKKSISPVILKKFQSKNNKLICPAIRKGDLFKDVKVLNMIVNLYKDKYRFYRLMENNAKKFTSKGIKKFFLIIFPEFRIKDIILISQKGLKIPSGITRHIIPKRVLRVNIPLNLLKSKASLASKNQWLKKFIEKKRKNNQIRYYQEPVFVYDE